MPLPPDFSQDEAVEVIMEMIDRIAEKITSDAGRKTLREYIQKKLREGTLAIMDVIAAARAGNDDADVVLRELAIEMLDRGEMPGAALRAYTQEALRRAPIPSPRGRNIADTWKRDVGIAALVHAVAVLFELPRTRNPASKQPSAAWLASLALNRKGFSLGERQVNKICGNVDEVAAKLYATIPAI